MSSYGYEEMLKIGKPLSPADPDLDALAEFMSINRKGIPAGYVYLGQFIDHDITSEQRRGTGPNDPFGPAIKKLSDLTNHRTPFLNLETIYGFETSQHGEPSRDELLVPNSAILRLGKTAPGIFVKKELDEKDLWRPDASRPCALLVDKRNDENLAVAQTHVMFARFHNEVVRRVIKNEDRNAFADAQKIVIQHYQWIVLYDFLPRILKMSVLADVVKNGNRFYFPKRDYPYLPIEFTVGAFRLGHSMVADHYNWNRLFNNDPTSDYHFAKASLGDLRRFTGPCKMAGFPSLIADWLINWFWFYDITDQVQDDQGEKMNLAEPIGTKLATLTMPTAPQYERRASLAARDLFRNKTNLSPSGQTVAKLIHDNSTRVLTPKQIANLLPAGLKGRFSDETPLWFYLLAEAEIEERGETFGEVASRIMAEVIVELIRLSPHSILDGEFTLDELLTDGAGRFGMPQLIEFVTKKNRADINPIGSETLDPATIQEMRLLENQRRRELSHAESKQEDCDECQ